MRTPARRFGIVLSLLAFAARTLAQDIAFDTVAEGRQHLGIRDDLVTRIGSFEIAARLKTNGPVTAAQYVSFMQGTVREWTPAQRAKLEAAFTTIRPALKRLRLPLPPVIHLVHTSGAGEGNMPYTRGDAVVFPTVEFGNDASKLASTFAHELFHVASRANPGMRDRVYAAIGFEPCGEVRLPESLRERRLTNPDAPVDRHAIQVAIDGTNAWLVPVIYFPATFALSDLSDGSEFFDHIASELLVVQRTPDGGHTVPGGPAGRLVSFGEARAIFDRVGHNTGYTIHPEEMAADNFMILATGGKRVKSPDVLERIRVAIPEPNPR